MALRLMSPFGCGSHLGHLFSDRFNRDKLVQNISHLFPRRQYSQSKTSANIQNSKLKARAAPNRTKLNYTYIRHIHTYIHKFFWSSEYLRVKGRAQISRKAPSENLHTSVCVGAAMVFQNLGCKFKMS